MKKSISCEMLLYLLASVADPFLVATEDASFVELYLFHI